MPPSRHSIGVARNSQLFDAKPLNRNYTFRTGTKLARQAAAALSPRILIPSVGLYAFYTAALCLGLRGLNQGFLFLLGIADNLA